MAGLSAHKEGERESIATILTQWWLSVDSQYPALIAALAADRSTLQGAALLDLSGLSELSGVISELRLSGPDIPRPPDTGKALA